MADIENTTPQGNETPAPVSYVADGDDDFTRAAIEAAEAEALSNGAPSAEEAAALEAVASDGDGADQKPVRPENVPEKFWDAEKGAVNTEALLKSYTELEKTRSKPAEEAPKTGEEAPPEGELTDEQKAAKADAEKSVGLDLTPFYEDYAKTGEVSAEKRAELNKLGIPDALIDAYVEGQAARSTLTSSVTINEVKGAIGGDAEYAAMAAWAKENVSEADLAEFNASVTNIRTDQDKRLAKLAVKDLYATYKANSENLPRLRGGKAPPGGQGGDVYSTLEEVIADQSDPRYENDLSYRAKVDAKLERSAPSR